MKTKEKHPIESLTNSGLWVERLLELFWAVDEVLQSHEDEVHPLILQAYQNAERARKQL